MTITRPIGAASTFDTTREIRERRNQGPRGAATQVRTGVGGDRGHGGAHGNARDTEAQARAFEGALARGGPQKTITQDSQDTLSDRPSGADETGERFVGHGDVEQDREGGDRHTIDDASRGSEDAGVETAGTTSSGTAGPWSTLRDAGVPPNTRRSSDADRRGGNGAGDRDGFARHTQDALLAALTRPLSRPYSGPLPTGGLASLEMRGPLYASPLSQAANAGAQDAGDNKAVLAVLRGMQDAIDALRVDVDGRRGVEMDISVPGTHGITVRVEEVDGCLQTTLSCRDVTDARRLQLGVQTLADHLAVRFVRAARVRIETSESSAEATPRVSPARAADTVQHRAMAGQGKHVSQGGRDLVAEAFAPLPGGESI